MWESLNSFFDRGYAIVAVINNARTVPTAVEARVIPAERHISLLAKIHFQDASVNSTGSSVTAFIFTAFLELKDSDSTDKSGTSATTAMMQSAVIITSPKTLSPKAAFLFPVFIPTITPRLLKFSWTSY